MYSQRKKYMRAANEYKSHKFICHLRRPISHMIQFNFIGRGRAYKTRNFHTEGIHMHDGNRFVSKIDKTWL